MPAKPTPLHRASVSARLTEDAPPPQLPATGFVREAQMRPTFVPFSSATLRRMVANHEFPRPVKLSQRVTAWRVEDVRAWLQAVGAGKAWVAHGSVARVAKGGVK